MQSLNKIALVQLISGETLIGQVRTEGEERIGINFPFMLVTTSNGIGHLQPWIFCKEMDSETDELVLNPLSIVTIATPTDDIFEAYNELRNSRFSKIVKPTKDQQKIITNT